jgi:hypothetical protein
MYSHGSIPTVHPLVLLYLVPPQKLHIPIELLSRITVSVGIKEWEN